jgi:diguanylate cyclase (GGDEF)-like protein/PAS domain S-box-containing protein
VTKEDGSAKRWNWSSFLDGLGPSIFVGLLLPDGTLMHANETALRAVGVKMGDVAGMPFDQTPWWKHSPQAQQELRAALAAGARGESSRFEVSIRAADGRVIALDFSLHPVLDEHGSVAFLVPSGCDVTEQRRAEQRISYVSEHDVLTGLPNQRWLRRHLAQELRQAPDAKRSIAVLCIDIDRFGRIDAALGRPAADAVLKAIAGRIAGCLGPADRLVRFESDEFVVTLRVEPGDASHAGAMASMVLDQVALPVSVAGQDIFVTASIGVAIAGPAPSDADGLLRKASIALDRAKRKGRCTWVVHAQEHETSDPGRFFLEAALRDAIARDELELVYQPQVDIASGEIVGVEALLRWEHPTLGAVSPDRFIPIAEEAGLIVAIGDWVLRTACETASAWQRKELPPIRTMVNVSACQLQQGDMDVRVRRVLRETGLDPRRFGIELTESVLMQDMSEAAGQLGDLRSLGVEIALDDFGTGYSSLSYLSRLPLDVVKIDRSLVPAVTGNSNALPITRAIIAMGHSLGMKVVAEGVETEGQLELLAANRCDQFQGFHFCAPTSAEHIEVMLGTGQRHPALDRRRAARVRTVLVVDDDAVVADNLKRQLAWKFGEAVRVEAFVDSSAALKRLHETQVDVLVSDLRMPGVDGIALMIQAKAIQPHAVRMMLLGPSDLARVIEDARQVDVFRYLWKPWTGEQLVGHFQAALDKVDQSRGEQALSEAISAGRYRPSRAELELLRLEEADPGITSVARGPLDEVLLPSQLMTLPGDLWAGEMPPRSGKHR